MDANADVSAGLQDKIEQELEPGEKALWIGSPIPRYFTTGALAMFLFGIPWTGFALFWTTMGVWGMWQMGNGHDAVGLLPLLGLPFIAIGLLFLSAPLWLRRKALRTVYAVTDRRAITIEGGLSTTIRSYMPADLRRTYRRQREDGSGDILIDCRAWRDADGSRHADEVCFSQIRNVRDIEQMLRYLASKTATSAAITSTQESRV